jgi:hypothetical protein
MQGFNRGAESQNRTGDTALFRRVLYRLSYLGDGSGFAVLPMKPRVARAPLGALRRHCVSLSGGYLHSKRISVQSGQVPRFQPNFTVERYSR